MVEDKRSATDILLSLESKVITMEKRVQNIEYLLKALLGKNNKSQSIPPATLSLSQTAQRTIQNDVINKDNFEDRPKTNRFEEMAASHGVKLGTYEEASSGEMEEAPIRSLSRGQRGPKKSGSKTSVSQILSSGNSPVFLANIEILDDNNELVSQTRTNPKGRWLMALAPGDYQVHVTKRYPPDSGKASIDTMYQINVPPTDKPLELDPFMLEMG